MNFKSWIFPTGATVVLIGLGVYIFFAFPQNSEVQVEGLIGAIATAAAFIWLIAGYIMQSKELKLQRKALEQQKKELARMSELSVLTQIRLMLEDAKIDLKETPAEFINPQNLLTSFSLVIMPHIKTISESEDAEEVWSACEKFFKVYGPIRAYLSIFTSAAKLYFKFTEKFFVDQDDPIDFLHVNKSIIKNIPYLQDKTMELDALVPMVYMCSPMLKIYKVAFAVSGELNVGLYAGKSFLNEEALRPLLDELSSKNSLPAICKKHPLCSKYFKTK